LGKIFSRKAAQEKVKTKKHDGQRRRKERRQRRTHQLESEGPGARRRWLLFLSSSFSSPSSSLFSALRVARALFRKRERENSVLFFQNSRGDLLLSRAYISSLSFSLTRFSLFLSPLSRKTTGQRRGALQGEDGHQVQEGNAQFLGAFGGFLFLKESNSLLFALCFFVFLSLFFSSGTKKKEKTGCL